MCAVVNLQGAGAVEVQGVGQAQQMAIRHNKDTNHHDRLRDLGKL